MPNIFSKNENLKKSPPYIGAKILAVFEREKSSRLSMFELARLLKKDNTINVANIYAGLIFLYSIGMIDLDETYVVKNV